ncbi:MAG: succinate dehydrogenase [Rubricoccaceae bacterium]|nr:succinate dehydrogenase [Rubricoccaceae bacterium]
MSKTYGRTARSSAFQWFTHRITGTFLVFLLITHFWVQHYDRTTRSVTKSVITAEEAERGVLPEYSDEANEAVRERQERMRDGDVPQPIIPAEGARSTPTAAQPVAGTTAATPYDVLMLRLADPVYAVLWKGFNLLFLVFALHHGFYGLNNILTDYIRNDMVRVTAVTLSWALALVLFVVGSYSVIVAGLNV